MKSEKREITSMQLGEYVHQAAELEKDIYTLQEAEKAFIASANELRRKKFNPKEPVYAPYPDQPDPPVKVKISDHLENFFDIISRCWILGIIIFFSVSIFLESLAIWDIDTHITIGIICALVYFGIRAYITGESNKKNEKEYQKKLKEYHSKYATVNNRNKTIKMEYNKECAIAAEKHIKACTKADIIQEQANMIREKLNHITTIRNKFYSLGVIPPDYRTIDCVYVLDHIFKNDLASDVRSAILLYKDWEFKGDVIRGMTDIIRQISTLNNRMYYLTQDISAIQMSVNLMSQDTARIAEAQSTQNNSINMILEHSKATRYASEAVQKHIEKTKKYYNIG